jgi:polyisoprenyl-teichoic acid--peptidoglycan teichoic acid transferase
MAYYRPPAYGLANYRPGPPPRPPRRGPRWGVLLAVGLIGLLLSGGGGALAYFLPALTAAVSSTGQTVAPPAGAAGQAANPPAQLAPTAPFTVLFLGSDNDSKFQADQLLTQSMILVRVDPVARHVTMLSIPRDLYVPISRGGSNKIDAAYINGGAATSIATVSRDFQVRIDDYVWIGLQGLVKLIDLVGGVDVTATAPVMDDFYPADVESTNAYGYERVAVLAGPQHLDGVHAMEYVRSRHSDLQGDVGRSKRQQAVLIALRAKARYLTAADIPDLATTFNGQFKTSIPLTRIRALLPLAQALSDPNQVKQVFLDGSPYYSPVTLPPPVGDALKPNWSSILPLVHQDFPTQ